MTIETASSPFGTRPSFDAGFLPYLSIVALYCACTLLVDPRGSFPLNDDWSYTRSAFRFGLEGRMRIDEWSAPTLVGQAIYGGMLVKIFGPSFLALRLSTLALACTGACLLWTIFRRLYIRAGLSWIAVLAWIFNPIWFNLTFSYMTEVPFLVLVMLAALFYLIHLQRRDLLPLALCGAALGYSFLIRQTAVLFIVPLLATSAMKGGISDQRPRLRRCIVLAGTAGLFIAVFLIWSRLQGGSTPAAQRKFELIGKITTTQFLGNLFGLAFYLGLFVFPLLVVKLPKLVHICREAGKQAWFCAAGWTGVSSLGLLWFHTRYAGTTYLPARSYHAQMPFLLNILYDSGLGPVTLDPTYYGTPPTPTHPALWLIVTYLIAAATAILGMLITLTGLRLRRTATDSAHGKIFLFSALCFICVIGFEVVFSHIQEGGLFDRHILTAAFPLFLILLLAGEFPTDDMKNNARPAAGGDGITGRAAEANRTERAHGGKSTPSRATVAVAWMALSVLAWFSVTATHDYLSWNRLRWELGNKLLAQEVDPLTLSGGFEFNAWHNYDRFRARGNIGRVYYWWYDRLDYLITMEPQEAYHVIQKKEYFSWLHWRNLPVYVLKKD